MAEEVYRIDITVNFNDQYKNELKEAEREVTKFEKSVERTEKRLERTSRSRWRITLDAVDRASQMIQRVGDFAARTASRTYRITIGVRDFATRPLRAIGRLATSTLVLLGAGAGIAGGIVWPTKLADDLTTAQIAFETMLGSSQKAIKFMHQIYEFAERTPFGKSEVISLAQGLLVRGFRQNEVIPMLERIGNVTAAMGTGAEGIDRIIYALGQMRALGKVSAEEMNQLTEAGVRAWDYLAKGMGKSIAEVRKLAEDGKISADEAIKHILTGMKEFDGMMQKVSTRTVRGLLSQIMDVFEINIFTAWGRGIQKEAVPALKAVRDWFDRNKQTTSQWAEVLEQAGSTATRLVVRGVRWLQKEMSALVNSREWREASGPFEKMSLAWNRIVVEPFSEWWSKSGKQKVEEIAAQIGAGIGGGLGAFISSALGAEVEDGKGNVFVDAGATAGKKFMEGFFAEFHGGEIAKRLLGLFRDIQPSFLGGQNDSLLGSVAALMFDAWLFTKAKNILSGPFTFGKNAAKRGWDIGKNVTGWIKDTRTGGLTGALQGSPLSPNDPSRPPVPTWLSLPGRMFGRIRNIFKWPGKGGPPSTGIMAGKLPGISPWLSLLGLFNTPQEQMPEAIGGIAGGMAGSALGAAIGSIIPGAGTAIGGIAGGFLGSMLGEKIGGMFGQGNILSSLDNLKNTVSSKFTEIKESAIENLRGLPGSVAEQFGYVVGYADEKMSQLPGTVGSWSEQTVASITNWFSNLPSNVSTWWSGVYSSISSWAQSAYNSVTTWIGGIPGAIQSAFERAREAWGGFKSWVSEKWRQFNEGLNRGREDAKKYAHGGYVSRPHLGLVGEAGPEMIIPLSPSRRSRGLELWEQAGRYLGVRQYADGGIVPMAPQSPAGGNTHVSVGDIHVTVSVDLGNVNQGADSKAIAKEIFDDVAYELAVSLRKMIPNMIITFKPE